MSESVTLKTIRTQIPARLDRLPWARFHWHVVVGLGTVWILDGLEVTIVGAIGARLTEQGSGINMSAADIGTAAAIYVAGACVGALFFGQLTDRFGRRRLMMLTLTVYILATVATAFAFAPWYFFLCRFVTGAGIGGEYAAINSAIDELIPARNRGQVDITINGSYWVGSAIGGLAALLFLDTSLLAKDVGWRISFAVGAILGLGILLVRRTLPESPRWLFIHGREDEAERIVNAIERSVRAETHQELAEPASEITVRQRASIPFRELAKVAVRYYPKRATLGLALFVGQAFLYNAVTFDLGTLMHTFYGVSSSAVPYFTVIFALGNFAGPLLLGRLFDTVGRKPMISGTYLVSAGLTLLLAILLAAGSLNRWSFIAVVSITFFFASAGASSAYLTVSEIFPMETRALAIAFFYAVGTGVGGISGPLLFGNFIDSGRAEIVAIGFFIGAGVMAPGGIPEIAFGVRAERVSLENIAKPLTVAEAERAAAAAPAAPEPAGAAEPSPERRKALHARERAEEERGRAAEHRARAHELRAAANGGGRALDERLHAEDVLAQVAELRAQALDEEATAHDEQAAADAADDDAARNAALDRAQAAHERARTHGEQAEALTAEHVEDAQKHAALSDAAAERARAREQRSLADTAHADAQSPDADTAEVAKAQAQAYDLWAEMHEERGRAHEARASGDADAQRRHDQAADALQERALGAEERVDAARHRVAAGALGREEGAVAETDRSREQAAERERKERERDERIRARLARQRSRDVQGLRRFRPGPGTTLYSPGMVGTASRWAPTAEQDLDREIEVIARALDEHGTTDRDKLYELVGARYWGPGRFRAALREAVEEGEARRVGRSLFAPPEPAQRSR